MSPDSYRVIVTEVGSVLYTTELSIADLDHLILTNDGLNFIDIPHIDGTKHRLRCRSIIRIFESTPESRERIDYLNHDRNVELAAFNSDRLAERTAEVEKQLGESNPTDGFSALSNRPPEA